MEDEKIERYLEMGKYVKRIKGMIIEENIRGKSFLEVCEWLEKEIIRLGFQPAFPVNLSIDEVAAHDTAGIGDGRKVDGNVIKVDFGIQKEGYIVDIATTLVFNKEYTSLKKASEEALRAAADVVKPGVEIWKIGEIIEETIKSFGFNPIYNLSGHQIEKYKLHGGISIPNYNNGDRRLLKEGMIIAIEPFATNGSGFVEEVGKSGILRLENWRNIRIPSIRQFLMRIERLYKGLPFAKRWIYRDFRREIDSGLLDRCIALGVIYEYPRLVEVSGKVVTQEEATIVVYDPPIVII